MSNVYGRTQKIPKLCLCTYVEGERPFIWQLFSSSNLLPVSGQLSISSTKSESFLSRTATAEPEFVLGQRMLYSPISSLYLSSPNRWASLYNQAISQLLHDAIWIFPWVVSKKPMKTLLNKTKGTLVHERGWRLLEGVEAFT